MADVISIERMLRDLGITASDAQQSALAALVDAGVISSRPNRTNIAANKIDRARATLEAAFVMRCGRGDCKRRVAHAGATLLVAQPFCGVCGGSGDRRALKEMAATLSASGMSRILVVGGTRGKWREIEEKATSGVEWRFVDGTKSRDDRYFRDNRSWAEVIAIWSSTPLDHRVSKHFTGRNDGRVITVPQRSVAALAGAVGEHVSGRRR